MDEWMRLRTRRVQDSGLRAWRGHTKGRLVRIPIVRSLTVALAALALIVMSAAPMGAAPSKQVGSGCAYPNGLQPVGWTGSQMQCLYFDEFNDTALDGTKWSTCYPWANPTTGCTNNPGSELEWYLPRNVTESGGSLHLRAVRENYTVNGTTYTWTSGMIASGGQPGVGPKMSATYGYYEARIKTPGIVGSWPAFWSLANNQSWPPEIDFLETFGGHPDTASLTYHYPPSGVTSTDVVFPTGTFGGQWHVIGANWRAGRIDWYIDGVWRKTATTSVTSLPMYELFDLAVSSSHPPAAGVNEMNMYVDYFRAWQ
jgi:beta-glucanase (GH16 family)